MTCRASSGASASAGPSSLSGDGKRQGAVDLYAQALKALTERSPFDSEEALARVSTLPAAFATVLSRSLDGRRKQKKADGEAAPPSRPPKPVAASSGMWTRMEPYFRAVSLPDIELLASKSRLDANSADNSFLVPSISAPFVPCKEEVALAQELPVEVNLSSNEAVSEGAVGVLVENQTIPDNVEALVGSAAAEAAEDASSMNWVIGSKQRCLLASERPNKKRKALGIDAGLEQLVHLPRHSEQGSWCDVCCLGESGSESNKLISCHSCRVTVHRKCYGVPEELVGNWFCAWCKHLELEANTSSEGKERPCLLCPKGGGALKPIEENSRRNLNIGSGVFAHLFCSLWAPELYVENIRAMEPVLNICGMKETRLKLVCCLCKMKHGACARCSHGTCRTSFHPICARDANLQMEVWGKYGCENVELRAFCSKHSDLRGISTTNFSERLTTTVSNDSSVAQFEVQHNSKQLKLKFSRKIKDKGLVQSQTKLHVDQSLRSESPEKDDSRQLSNNDHTDSFNVIPILKKLIDQKRITTGDLATTIGVSTDSLESMVMGETSSLTPELSLNVRKLLQESGYLPPVSHGRTDSGTTISTSSPVASAEVLSATNNMVDTCDIGSVQKDDIGEPDGVCEKVLPQCGRAESNMQILKEDKSVNEVIPCTTNDSLVDRLNEIPLFSDDKTTALLNVDNDVQCYLPNEQHHVVEDSSQRHLNHDTNAMDSATSNVKFGEFCCSSYVHPLIQRKLYGSPLFSEQKRHREVETKPMNSAELASASTLNGTSDIINEGKFEQLVNAGRAGILGLSPSDEVEGELVYLQDKLFEKSMEINHISDKLLSKVLQNISQEMDSVKKQRWDQVLIVQYLREVKEAKRKGWKEKRHKEAQAVLAAAVSAAATSRNSSLRKDANDDGGPAKLENPVEVGSMSRRAAIPSSSALNVKESHSRAPVIKVPPDKFSNMFQIPEFSKGNGLYCDICKRTETLLNRIFVCSSCKIAVHLDCYKRLNDPIGPWKCEYCEDMLVPSGSPSNQTADIGEKDAIAHCGLCGGHNGAFRKSTDGQWVHSFCAEWLLESTFKRGQPNLVDGMDLLSKEKNVLSCCICHQRVGSCLKCSYGNCQASFHPTCARNAGLYMNIKTVGGRLQHKAYCEKHSVEQREKADSQQYGTEELKNIKNIRVELEKMRLLCERIVKREKVKRDLVLCSHDFLASRRDFVAISVLIQSSLFSHGASSESATTSLDNRSLSGMVQRSDDYTVDSTFSGNHSVKGPSHNEIDRKTEDSLTSQLSFKRKLSDMAHFSGKQLPRRTVSAAFRGPVEDGYRKSKVRKQVETFQKELIMTSDQASIKNQKLPQGFVYVPVGYVSKEKLGNHDTASHEPQDPGG